MAAAPESDSSSSCRSSPAPELTESEQLDLWLQQKRMERLKELKAIDSVGATANMRRGIEQKLFNLETEDAPSTSTSRADDDDFGAGASNNAVVVEVRGLFETRPVTRMLQSNGFRARLENIVRSVVTNDASPAPPRRVAASSAAAPHPSTSTTAAAERPHPRPRRNRQVPSPPPPALPTQTQTAPPPAPPIAEEPAVAVAQNLFYVPQSAAAAAAEEGRSLLQHQQREDFIAEISELLHRQLVSATLESNFRGSLERRMADRLSNIDENSRQAALETLNNLPPSGIVRNDFSHLGLHVAQAAAAAAAAAYAASENSEDDALSIISATAQTVPMAETNSGMARQMASMRREMTALKEQIQLQMEMQMDTQRMLRQELAAALSGATATPAPQPPVSDAGKCLICLESRADTVMYRCGHLCMCFPCGARMRQQGAAAGAQQQQLFKCPVCRAPVFDLIRAYAAGVDNEE